MARVDTATLIRTLGDRVVAVEPLPRPWRRAIVWLAVSLPYLLILAFVMRSQGGVVEKLADNRFVAEQLAAFATAIFAAAAAFATTVPGANRKLAFAALAASAVWMALVANGCVREARSLSPSQVSLTIHWGCIPATVIVGAAPAVAIVRMLRRGAPLAPRLTLALAGLAAGAIANVGVRFVHAQDARVIVLAWHVGVAFAVSGLAASLARGLLNWSSLKRRQSVAA